MTLSGCGETNVHDNETFSSTAESENTEQSSEYNESVPDDTDDKTAGLIEELTLEQKVGQMFFIRPEQLAESYYLSEDSVYNTSEDGISSVSDVMKEEYSNLPVGGFVLFARNIVSPDQVTEFTAELSALGSPKPIIAVDEEGGIVTRIASNQLFDVPQIDSMENIGMTEKTENAWYAGSTIGEYLKNYGFNWDFAPVADLNTNPDNPVIGERSFGSDPKLASEMAAAYIDGLHGNGVSSTLKHFPGHGDTSEDTHSGFVAVYKTWEELSETELVPFKENLEKTDAVMTAHITLPEVSSDGLPASLSYEITTEKLRNELGFDGVIVCDSLSMGAITENYSSAEAAVLAVNAGCDVLLTPQSVQEAYDGVLNAVRSGDISEERINESVERILKLKEKWK